MDWNEDQRPDLLVGHADGTVWLYLNDGQPGEPHLAAGEPLMAGPAGAQLPVSVGARATPEWTDWDQDGLPDLLVGALDGRVRLALNQGQPGLPFLASPALVYAVPGVDLLVPGGRSSLVVWDENGDDLPDLISGNTNGQLLFTRNTGTLQAPAFADWEPVSVGGEPFDLSGSLRSRPAHCDWNEDGLPDLLVGYGDGLLRLALGQLEAPGPLQVHLQAAALHLSWPAGGAGESFRVYRRALQDPEWFLAGEVADSCWVDPMPAADAGRLYRVTRLR